MELKTRLAAQSRVSVHAGDRTKIGAAGRYRSIPFSDIETFVTDKPLGEPFAGLLTKAGASVLYPEQSASHERSEISELPHLQEKVNDNG